MDGHKFCGHCGSELKLEEKFCGNCGTPVVETPVQPTTPVVGTPAQPVTPVAEPAPTVTAAPIVTPVQTPITTEAPKKQIKKPVLFGVAAVVVLIVGIIAAIIANLPKTRTVMVYMIGSNLESEHAAGTDDIKEMVDSKFDQEHVKVLVYTGGANRWKNPNINASENAIFEVKDGDIKKIQSFDKKTMTEGTTLTEFIDFAYKNYESNLYDLILWDHGGGPVFGYGDDEAAASSKPMLITELAKALEDSELVKSKKQFEVIGFDACLMGSIETGIALKDYSKFMIASEESEPGQGWNYEFLGTITGKTNSEELGTSIVDKFISHYDDYGYDVGLSLSFVELNKLDKVAESANKLFGIVNEEINARNFSSYSQTMARKRIYGYNGRDSESLDLVDLVDLASSLRDKYPNEVAELEENAEKAIIYNKTNLDSTNGLSVYFPTNNKVYLERLMTLYKNVAFSDDYYKFLSKYSEFITGRKFVSRSSYDGLKENVKGGGSSISIELPDELVENYQKGEVMIYRKLGDNKFAPVYRSSEVTLNNSKLIAESNNLQFIVKSKDKNGKVDHGWITAYEKYRTADYADYVSFGVLYEKSDTALGMSPRSYEMHIRVKKGEAKAEIRDIRVASDSDGLAGKYSFKQEDIMIIEMTVPTYKLLDESGKRLDEIKPWGQIYGTSLNLKDGDSYEILLEGFDFDFGNMYAGTLDAASLGDYYAEFIVYDTQGNGHRLNLIHIK